MKKVAGHCEIKLIKCFERRKCALRLKSGYLIVVNKDENKRSILKLIRLKQSKC